MAQIRELKTGFQVRWREGGRGSLLLNSDVFPTRAAALAEKQTIEARLAARGVRRRALLPFDELVERWALSRISRGNDPMWTRIAADRILALARRSGWRSVADVTVSAVERWRAGHYVARLGTELRAVLWWAMDFADQPVHEKVLVALRPPRQHRKVRDLVTDDFVAGILRDADAVSDNFGALIHCLSTYGWRPISAAKLVVGDVDLARGTITLRGLKGGGHDLMHPLLVASIGRLKRAIGDRAVSEPLFLNPRTGRGWDLRGDCIYAFYHKWAKGQGVYDLKRWAISRMLERGMAPQQVAAFTGHKTISQVLGYARTNLEKSRAALAMLG